MVETNLPEIMVHLHFHRDSSFSSLFFIFIVILIFIIIVIFIIDALIKLSSLTFHYHDKSHFLPSLGIIILIVNVIGPHHNHHIFSQVSLVGLQTARQGAAKILALLQVFIIIFIDITISAIVDIAIIKAIIVITIRIRSEQRSWFIG